MSLLRSGMDCSTLTTSGTTLTFPIYDNAVRIWFRSVGVLGGTIASGTNITAQRGRRESKIAWALGTTQPPIALATDIQYWAVFWKDVSKQGYGYQTTPYYIWNNQITINTQPGNNRPETGLNLYFWRPNFAGTDAAWGNSGSLNIKIAVAQFTVNK